MCIGGGSISGYNTIAQVKGLVGQTVSQEQIDYAKSMIDDYSEWRWASTSHVDVRSGNGEQWMQMISPIISVTTLTIDDVDQTEGTDFEIRKPEGRIYTYGGLPWGHDNISITYTYGFTSEGAESEMYNRTFYKVKMAEAQIALYIKKNPMLLDSVNIEGSSIKFNDIQLRVYLNQVPKPITFATGGPSTATEVWGETLL